MRLVSYIITCRDKAEYVWEAMSCGLAQTYPRMEVIISDHGSTDGTLDLIHQRVSEYSGPHKVKILQCPDTELKGMAGLNRHLNWILPQCEGEIITASSADDICSMHKIERVMQAFHQFEPSWVSCTMGHQFEGEQGGQRVISYFPDRGNRFIQTAESIKYIIGAPAQCHWKREFMEKYLPLQGIECITMFAPILATFEQGFFFLDEDLHTQVQRSGPNIVGVEGQARAAKDETEKLQIHELATFNYTSHWVSILKRIQDHGYAYRLTGDDINALHEKLIGCAGDWAITREKMTLEKIPPIPFRV